MLIKSNLYLAIDSQGIPPEELEQICRDVLYTYLQRAGFFKTINGKVAKNINHQFGPKANFRGMRLVNQSEAHEFFFKKLTI